MPDVPPLALADIDTGPFKIKLVKDYRPERQLLCEWEDSMMKLYMDNYDRVDPIDDTQAPVNFILNTAGEQLRVKSVRDAQIGDLDENYEPVIDSDQLEGPQIDDDTPPEWIVYIVKWEDTWEDYRKCKDGRYLVPPAKSFVNGWNARNRARTVDMKKALPTS
jgi:hypothetical protein